MSFPPAPNSAVQDLLAARRHFQQGELALAATAARRAALADPSNREAHGIWGIAAVETGDYAGAIDPLRIAAHHATAGSPRWALFNSQLALALWNIGYWRQGLERLEPVEQLASPDPMVRNRIGIALVGMNLAERGLPHLEFAAAASPKMVDLLCDLGWALMSLGRLGDAEARFDEALALKPEMPRAHLAVAGLRTSTAERNHLDRLAALRASPSVNPADHARLGYAIFKELDDLGRCDEAWPVLEGANAFMAALPPPWSAGDDDDFTKALIKRFPRSAFSVPQPARETGRIPVFIVGLPRTGTTLVERILAAHSQVHAMGELPLFPRLFREAAGAEGPWLSARDVMATRSADWPALGAIYSEESAFLTGGARFAIDKLPFNSLLIGAVKLALPNARIILLRRDPMDTLFSAYRTLFPQEGVCRWSYRLEDLASHYRHHHRLMGHWRTCLREGLIEISYEKLVAEPEAQIRALVAACGLGFEEACLRPHESTGAVLTVSSTQVRSPMTASHVGAWRQYQTGLEPLRARLDALGLLGAD
ncbi:MAG TPA: sulfotransferase [Caulobacteraceae bacterium]